PAIRAQGAAARVVDHSLAALDAAKARLDRAAARRATTETPVWYVDVPADTQVVRAVRTGAARSLPAAAHVDASLVQVVKSAEHPRPLHDLRGGDAYSIDGSTRCSFGSERLTPGTAVRLPTPDTPDVPALGRPPGASRRTAPAHGTGPRPLIRPGPDERP
ncbi:alpha-lytic protease prodomain-containing protein, partial [Streptomyces sp. NPDC001356]